MIEEVYLPEIKQGQIPVFGAHRVADSCITQEGCESWEPRPDILRINADHSKSDWLTRKSLAVIQSKTLEAVHQFERATDHQNPIDLPAFQSFHSGEVFKPQIYGKRVLCVYKEGVLIDSTRSGDSLTTHPEAKKFSSATLGITVPGLEDIHGAFSFLESTDLQVRVATLPKSYLHEGDITLDQDWFHHAQEQVHRTGTVQRVDVFSRIRSISIIGINPIDMDDQNHHSNFAETIWAYLKHRLAPTPAPSLS